MATIEWEEMGHYAFDLERLRVPGGWLVRTGIDNCVSICFYPDPEHLWK